MSSDCKENALESWVHSLIKSEIEKNSKLRESIDKKDLSEIEKEDVRKYKEYKLRRLVDYLYENSKFYRNQFQEVGVKPEEIKNLSDLEKIPLTDPSQMAENPYPFLCVPRNQILRGFTTSGTSGLEKRVLFTRDDLVRIVESIGAGLKLVGMSEGDTLHIMYPTIAGWDPGYMLGKACEMLGFSYVVEDTEDMDRQIKEIEENNSTFIIGLTSFLDKLTEEAGESHDLGGFGIKAIISSSEPLSETVRGKIEDAWGCKVLDQYGLTELGLAVAIECSFQNGLHVNDGDFIVEVVEPETGQRLGSGERGELVFTTLNRMGMPLLRYRTGDMSRLIEEPCECGARTTCRIEKVKRSLD